MSGVPLGLLLAPPPALMRYIQARLSSLTLWSLTFASGLNRRPEKSPLYVGQESVGIGFWA